MQLNEIEKGLEKCLEKIDRTEKPWQFSQFKQFCDAHITACEQGLSERAVLPYMAFVLQLFEALAVPWTVLSSDSCKIHYETPFTFTLKHPQAFTCSFAGTTDLRNAEKYLPQTLEKLNGLAEKFSALYKTAEKTVKLHPAAAEEGPISRGLSRKCIYHPLAKIVVPEKDKYHILDGTMDFETGRFTLELRKTVPSELDAIAEPCDDFTTLVIVSYAKQYPFRETVVPIIARQYSERIGSKAR